MKLQETANELRPLRNTCALDVALAGSSLVLKEEAENAPSLSGFQLWPLFSHQSFLTLYMFLETSSNHIVLFLNSPNSLGISLYHY